MPLSLLSLLSLPPPLPSLSLISCRATTSPPSPLSSAAPPPPQHLSLSSTSSASASPSLSCSLNCPHFQSCSGCTHEFNLHRPDVVEEAERFFKHVNVEDFTFDSCRLYGWRCRAKLVIRGSAESPLIGLYEEGTHNVVDIPNCQAHHPKINDAVELLKQGIKELNVEPYDEDQRTGDLRYVQMAVTTHITNLPANERYKNGKVQVALVWNSRNEKSPNSDKLVALANFLWRHGGPRTNVKFLHSVWANFQTSSSNVIFGGRWRHLLGEREFWEHVGGIDVFLDPSSFGQANTWAFDKLLRQLQKYVPKGASVTDLYAGAGAIGLSLAANRNCRSVKCVEINKESKLSFEKTVERLPNSLDTNISWHQADTSIDPLFWLLGSDVIVVDPPRKGLDPSLVDVLKNLSSKERRTNVLSYSSPSNIKEEKRPWVVRAREPSVQIGKRASPENDKSLPQTLIYISCGWESFKEDCKSLLSCKGWQLEKAHGFNFFPGTQSIEVMAVFKRGTLKKKKTGKKKK